MSQSNLPESSVPVETKQVTVIDSTQAQQELIAQEQFLQPRKKRNWLMILGIILIIIGSAGLGWRWWHSRGDNAGAGSAETAGAKPSAIPVKLATVETGTIRQSSEFIGFLEAARSVTLKPEIEGRVSQILVKEGDRTRAGQVIIRLQSDDAQAQLLQAKGTLEQSNARLAQLKAGTREEEIAQGRAKLAQAQARLADAQAGAQPEEIAQAQAQIEAAQADVVLAQSRGKRYQQLRTEGAVSQDQLEGYLQEQRSAEAKVREAQRKLEQLRKSRSSDISELTAAVEQEKQSLTELENGPRTEEIAQARSQVTQGVGQVQAAQAQLQYTRVLAPFTGVIGDIPVKVGDYVGKGDELTTLTKNDSLELNISVPLDQAKQLRLGLLVQMLDAQRKTTAGGRVSFISPNASADSQTVLVKAIFPNAGGPLLNRQSVPTRVIWDQRPGILIPVTAISRIGGETFVFVAQAVENPKPGMPSLVAQQKPVKLGAIEGNNYQVIEGLKAGEKIVVSGILSLTNGAAIKPAGEETSN